MCLGAAGTCLEGNKGIVAIVVAGEETLETSLLHLVFQGLVQALGLVQREAVVLHQFIHIQPVACRARHAAGGGVGLLQKACLGEHGHFIADGGGGEIHLRHLGDGLGAHRLRRADIQLHDAAQNFLFPVGQFHKGLLLFVSTL